MDLTEAFTAFDWVVITLVALLAIGGLMRGFTQEALSLAGWIVAIIVVRFFHQDLTLWLAPRVGGEASGAIIAFLLLFFGTVIVARIIAGMAGGFSRKGPLGALDRLLGLGFGALKGLILASVLFLLSQFATGLFDPDRTPPDWLVKSRSAPLLALSASAMVGWVNELQELEMPGAALKPQPHFGQPEPQLPPGHPQMQPEPQPDADEGGYSREDREALDQLLKEGAEKGDQVEI